MPVALENLNAMNAAEFAAALGDIYEYAPWVAEQVAARRPFATLAALHDAMQAVVRGAGADRQLALVRAHPDLAGKAARAGTLTAESTAEQTSAGLERLSEDEYRTFHRLNGDYRRQFGVPFIVCVRRHTKGSILRQFAQRLRNDAAAERDAALSEIFRIAALRLDQRVSAPDRLPVHGHLSTHVLDTQGGTPAAGIAVDLVEIATPSNIRIVAGALTNRDGRTDQPLISGRPIPIGTYELRFAVGAYFAERGVPPADPAFLDLVPMRFSVAEPEGRYHVPLLVSPWSYTTYRGS
ncbi:MAG: 2-oxo-4-hydroxy-4-carboxy-5-ureidoimidazoline decarboxylase [Rhizobiales bacterium]|nr:2-oxo-4-hydroxy-4-carboxy-5-ureidoimidazoline decarboxylase [Hyphomicrobiales bacterium]